VHLFRPSLSFLDEAQPRLENRRGQKAILAEVHIKFLGDLTNYKAKDITGKIANLFCICFQIDKFINTIFYIIFISLPTKRDIYCCNTITNLHNSIVQRQ
jgi:hypothetical protein